MPGRGRPVRAQANRAVGVDVDVFGLEGAVPKADLVEGRDRVEDAHRDRDRAHRRQLGALQERSQQHTGFLCPHHSRQVLYAGPRSLVNPKIQEVT